MSLNLHVPVTAQDLINDLNRQVESLRNETANYRIQINYILGCLERIPKADREKAGLVEEQDFQKRQQDMSQQSVKNNSGRPKVS